MTLAILPLGPTIWSCCEMPPPSTVCCKIGTRRASWALHRVVYNRYQIYFMISRRMISYHSPRYDVSCATIYPALPDHFLCTLVPSFGALFGVAKFEPPSLVCVTQFFTIISVAKLPNAHHPPPPPPRQQVYAALHGVVTLQQEVASILPRGNGPGGAGGEAIISTPGEASGEAWNGIIVRPEAQREMPGSGPKEGGAWSGNVLQGTPFGGIAVQVKAGAAPALSPSTSAAIATAAVVAASPRVSSAEDAAASAVAPGNWEGATATADKQGEGSGVGEEGVSQQQQPGVCPEADGEDATAPSDGSVPPTKGEASSYKRILEQLGS